MSGPLERSVMRSLVIPSLKYSWPRSPLMLVNGNTAIEGILGSGRAGFCATGIDAVVIGGRNERCCTSTIVAARIARLAIEKAPRRTYFRRTRCVLVPGLASAP